jgi:hypothetical protein
MTRATWAVLHAELRFVCFYCFVIDNSVTAHTAVMVNYESCPPYASTFKNVGSLDEGTNIMRSFN